MCAVLVTCDVCILVLQMHHVNHDNTAPQCPEQDCLLLTASDNLLAAAMHMLGHHTQ